MAKREKKHVIGEIGILLFDDNQVKVYKKPNGKLYFESTDINLGETFICNDYAESVAALMRLPNIFNNNKLWKIKINNKYDIKVNQVLYWLTGGDKEWSDNANYKFKWEEVESIFTHKFEDTILEIISKSNTLGDIKRGFMRHLNLPIIYEFSLNNNLID